MTDKPILFSAPMVRALLNCRKTQTRRVIKEPFGTAEFDGDEWRPIHIRVCRGDRLWVKETTFRCEKCSYSNYVEGGNRSAGGKHFHCAACDALFEGKQTPSIFMPRAASRITLTVTEVRVERLQDISEADAIAEGVFEQGEDYSQYGPKAARAAYRSLWESINGPGSWESNPWVAAYSFTIQRGNIDQVTS